MSAAYFWIAVVWRLFANPASNVLQKSLAIAGVRPSTMILLVHLLLTAACVPWLLIDDTTPQDGFWSNMLIAAAPAVVCNTLIAAALKHDDLSLLGPINSFKPLVSLPAAIVLLGEWPGLLASLGIALVVVGSYGLVADAQNRRDVERPALWRRPGVRLRVAALVVSAIEAVFLKRALTASNPATTFAWWSTIGLAVAAALVVVRRRRSRNPPWDLAAMRPYAGRVVGLAVTTGVMQFSTLYVFTAAPVASALALFQLSSIVNVVLGHHLFGEPHLVRRLIASTVMAAGAVLITLDR